MYKEIKELFKWCKKEKINCELLPLFDGYKLDFDGHRDVVQHFGSYRATEGYVEPYGFSKHCEPVSLEEMKKIILKEI
jgi:hypothetical protein